MEENLKATLLHPWFRNSNCLTVNEAIPKQQLISEIAEELNLSDEGPHQRTERPNFDNDSFWVIIISTSYVRLVKTFFRRYDLSKFKK